VRITVTLIVLLGILVNPFYSGTMDPMLQGASPPMLWHFDLDSNSYGGATVGDIDADGKFEVVFGTYMNGETLHALNAEDGSVLWKYWAGPGPLDASVKLVDVNDDGNLEVVFATSGSYGVGAGVMHCLHGRNGTPIWHYDPDTCTDSPPAIADIDNDSKLEVLYGTFNDGVHGGYVHILNAEDGSLAEVVGPFNGHIQSGPAVVDLDLDGQLDFVVTMFGGNDWIYAVNGSDYSNMWHYETGDSMYHTCSFSNLDDDVYPELVVGNYDGNVYALHGENGSLYWKHDVTYASYCTSIADVDGDSEQEVIAAGSLEVTVINSDGSHLWSESIYSSFRGAAMADVDGDGGLDVVIGGGDGLLSALDGATGATVWSFDAAEDYGETPFEIDHGPVIADLDSDEDLDIFFIGGRGYSGDPQNNYGRAYALELSFTLGGGWTMFHHDYCNSGSYGHETPGEIYGQVNDSVSGHPLEGAEIHAGSLTARTNENGTFIVHVPCGTHTLSVSMIGYGGSLAEVTVRAGIILDVGFALTPQSSTSTDTTTSTGPTGTGSQDILVIIFLALSGLGAAIALAILCRYRRLSQPE
jgi:outer membrane protein assembly factor BamB